VRPFRFAGTVTAAQAVSSFVAVGQDLAEARETAQYQLEQEERKKGKVRPRALWDGGRAAAVRAACSLREG
jgi:hypothetical protein